VFQKFIDLLRTPCRAPMRSNRGEAKQQKTPTQFFNLYKPNNDVSDSDFRSERA